MENFKKTKKIGEGSYGTVYEGKNKTTGERVAIKKIELKSEDEGIPSTALREIALLKELNHPNIITLNDVIMNERNLYLVFELLDMDLRKFMDSLPPRKMMKLDLVRSYMYQTTSAILFCHQRRMLHRDLKPQNLLIDKNGVIKVGDFGLARSFNIPLRPYTHKVGTMWYRSPEILLGSTYYSCPVDIWSIGCIFAEMVTCTTLFKGNSQMNQLLRIFRILTTPTEEIWPGVTKLRDYQACFPCWDQNQLQEQVKGMNSVALDLLAKTLVYDPQHRITAKRMLEHEYFSGFDKKLAGAT